MAGMSAAFGDRIATPDSAIAHVVEIARPGIGPIGEHEQGSRALETQIQVRTGVGSQGGHKGPVIFRCMARRGQLQPSCC